MDSKESIPNSSSVKIYLDYNATTPLDKDVLDEITHALKEGWGNPSSTHTAGLKAKSIIDNARGNVAAMIGAKQSEIVFTSGGTEANNMILQSAITYWKQMPEYIRGDGKPHFITSNMEHDSIKLVLEHFQEEGMADVTYVPVSKLTGTVDVDDIKGAICPRTVLITVMMANNETGVIQPIAEISKIARKVGGYKKVHMHTDAAQTIGKMIVDVNDLDVDYLTIVGHKFYGPRIGAVYAKMWDTSLELHPMLYGGGQERNFRPGTENTGMIAGLGKAAELVRKNIDDYCSEFKRRQDYLETVLMEKFGSRVRFNGKFATSLRIPNTCNMSFIGENLEGYKVLSKCKKIQASIGAACHAQNRPSPILLAIGVPANIAKNAIRISIGRETTMNDLNEVVLDLEQAVSQLTDSS